MKRARGFTLIELIITLIISAIIATTMIEIIAGPIRSYFWVSQRVIPVFSLEHALEVSKIEILQALPGSLQVSNEQDKQRLLFRKILYSGFVQNDSEKTNLKILSNWDTTMVNSAPIVVYFPSQPDKLFQGKMINGNNNNELVLDGKPKKSVTPQRFYLLSNVIVYQCDNKKKQLERFENNESALLNNNISTCQFSLNHEPKSLFLMLNVKANTKSKEPLVMTLPIMLGIAI